MPLLHRFAVLQCSVAPSWTGFFPSFKLKVVVAKVRMFARRKFSPTRPLMHTHARSPGHSCPVSPPCTIETPECLCFPPLTFISSHCVLPPFLPHAHSLTRPSTIPWALMPSIAPAHPLPPPVCFLPRAPLIYALPFSPLAPMVGVKLLSPSQSFPPSPLWFIHSSLVDGPCPL